MRTPRHRSLGWALHLVTHDVGGSHVHLVIVLLTLSGPGHLRLILNLEDKRESLELAGGWPTGTHRLQHTHVPPSSFLSYSGCYYQISGSVQLPSLVLF